MGPFLSVILRASYGAFPIEILLTKLVKLFVLLMVQQFYEELLRQILAMGFELDLHFDLFSERRFYHEIAALYIANFR
jgi:hypothetical protein